MSTTTPLNNALASVAPTLNVGSAGEIVTTSLTTGDLNDIVSARLKVYHANGGHSVLNTPAAIGIHGFYLLVNGLGTGYCRQQISDAQSLQTYQRFKVGNLGWKPWEKMLTESDLTPILNRLTALENK